MGQLYKCRGLWYRNKFTMENGNNRGRSKKFVHPTFLYESLGTIIIFVILAVLQDKRKFEGQIAYMYLALYSLLRFL